MSLKQTNCVLRLDTQLLYCVQHVLAQLGCKGFNIKQVEIPNICKYDHIRKVCIILK